MTWKTREEAQAECDAANEPLSDSQILAAAALDWNIRNGSASSRSRSWTKDPDGLLVAVRSAKTRREAIEAVATWRAVPRPPPAPEPAFEDEAREDPPSKAGDRAPAVMPVAVGAKQVLEALYRAPPLGTLVPRRRATR